jgi:D-arabinose 1-dehydrogenase-like Zn-dependent alcohol dehydrogenase
MRGLLFQGDRRAQIDNFDDPTPGIGEVVVAVKAAAICGSDMHGYRASAAERVANGSAFTIPGHEPSGVVHSIGEGVTGVKVGDRVAVYHFRSCGHCAECRSGKMQWCDDRRGYGGPIHGSDADFLLTDARNCLPLPDDASFALGAIMMCVGGTAFEAMKKLEAAAGHRVAIFGMGSVGLAGMMFARALGAEVIGIDTSPDRLALATSLGANAVIDAKNDDVREAVKRWAGKDGVSSSFETSGTAVAQSNSVAVTGRGGRIAFVGFGSAAPSIAPSEYIVKELRLMGSFVFPIDAYFRIMDFVRHYKVALEATITHSVPLEDAAEILPAFDRGQTGKVILVP